MQGAKGIGLGVALLALMGLSGCSTFDWVDTGRGLAESLCESVGNCENVCPDGSPTGTRVPRCDYREAN